ncbi:MAG TPA: pyridoxal phosphate-dependent aminotransferase [Chitinophagaceae bacterium]|nr:pyridoxal phosphate-dependent aminotransferase [Chitinophagaceae bacterium]HCY89833.1 pyridoxal phosphate-dependent aminotransferase [Chitinophagaceae bacterium]HRF25929.1 DegT/DnrJ/EryC1/StrS family aminotransferase [Ferruginibacter sp.]
MERVWLSSPHMGGKEKEYVAEAFATNWVAPLGPNVDAFEKQLAEQLGVKQVAALNTGTAALHLGLQLLGVQAGDTVLCQSFTFAASAFPILYGHAKPVFIDSEEQTWNMDPALLEQAITDEIALGKKPAAVIAVHLYGMPAQMNEIMAILDRYEIPLIEDAAEALGSTYQGKACGSFGKIGVLSFNGNKIITTSGGGALASTDEELVKKARFYSTQSKEPAPYYLHKEIGFNYRLSNICAGIGRGQMEVLPERVERRREIYDFYLQELGTIDGIVFLPEPEGSFSNRWLTTILFDEKIFGAGFNETVRQALEKINIETRPLWKPLHQQPVFSEVKAYLNGVSDKLFAEGLCLPSGSNTTDESLQRVVQEIKKLL